MEYNFKKFEGVNSRMENRITITNSNSVGFPTQFYNDNNIKRFEYVLLFWDAKNKAIGIKFTNEESEKSRFKILHSKIGYGGSITARSFLKANNIDPKLYHGRYDWKKEKVEGIGEIFIIELKEKQAKEQKANG
ncbi:MAG: hypothetical protein PHT24_06785 [Endomicrobiaceae bacterium]|nr:hypothetical protein [Endomicrobiaceae bacterium]